MSLLSKIQFFQLSPNRLLFLFEDSPQSALLCIFDVFFCFHFVIGVQIITVFLIPVRFLLIFLTVYLVLTIILIFLIDNRNHVLLENLLLMHLLFKSRIIKYCVIYLKLLSLLRLFNCEGSNGRNLLQLRFLFISCLSLGSWFEASSGGGKRASISCHSFRDVRYGKGSPLYCPLSFD